MSVTTFEWTSAKHDAPPSHLQRPRISMVGRENLVPLSVAMSLTTLPIGWTSLWRLAANPKSSTRVSRRRDGFRHVATF